MNKVIEQNKAVNIEIDKTKYGGLKIIQGFDSIVLRKDGAAELIKVLQEWVDE